MHLFQTSHKARYKHCSPVNITRRWCPHITGCHKCWCRNRHGVRLIQHRAPACVNVLNIAGGSIVVEHLKDTGVADPTAHRNSDLAKRCGHGCICCTTTLLQSVKACTNGKGCTGTGNSVFATHCERLTLGDTPGAISNNNFTVDQPIRAPGLSFRKHELGT